MCTSDKRSKYPALCRTCAAKSVMLRTGCATNWNLAPRCGVRQMSNEPRKTKADAELEREIRAERKFSLAEAIGRLAGPGSMKGASPVTRKRQAEAELQDYLGRHVADSAGILPGLLLRQVGESDLLLNNLDQPLVVLAAYVEQVLGSDYLLKELVREADAEWGRATGERPHFEQEGRPPHPDDPCTAESVRASLSRLLEVLSARDP